MIFLIHISLLLHNEALPARSSWVHGLVVVADPCKKDLCSISTISIFIDYRTKDRNLHFIFFGASALC